MRGKIEAELISLYPRIAGVDEVGRGCLAGPVYAAVVMLDYSRLRLCPRAELELLRDSKTLSPAQRQRMLPRIEELSLASAIAHAEVREIENLGIVPATFLAMTRALGKITREIDVLLIDGKAPLPGFKGYQRAVIKGDNLCFCIAAASILAKEARDRFMREAADTFPGYGFAAHVGYGTQAHLRAIAAQGPCSLHRMNFAPLRSHTSDFNAN
jgi:ribonuclease HII